MKNMMITNAAPLAPLLPVPCRAAVESAAQLLSHLAPLFPGVAAATKTDGGAAAWIASWARQIEVEGISHARVAGALTMLGELDPAVPLSWPRFSELVRRHRMREPNLQEDPAFRDRRLREFRARYPGARFSTDMPDG